jgi:ABC-type dipeptide/oligopeptide/nickel transport system, ATPase component
MRSSAWWANRLGKTVSLMSVMGLINDPNAVIGGSILYKGRELVGLSRRQLRAVRGSEIAMIFQDPMTALTPVYTIGWQIEEQIRAHTSLSRRQARKRAIELLGEVGIPNPAVTVDRYPMSSPVACASAASSPWRSPAIPRCSSPTSRRQPSM